MEYIFHILILFSIYGILALAQNLVMGEAGLLTVAGGAFYGIGAYVVAILTTTYGFSVLPSLIIAPVIAGGIAFIVGASFARFRDDYFLLATLGFLMIFNTLVKNWETFTGGAFGIAKIPKLDLFGFVFNTPSSFVWLGLFMLLVVSAISFFITNSSFGRVLNAIREDEDALKIFGYNTTIYKLLIFSFGAALSAVAGVLFASYLSFIDASLFTVDVSILLWSMIILGGMAKNSGALLGAFILIILPEFLRFVDFPNEFVGLARVLIYSLLLVFFMLYQPRGILGEYKI